MARSIVPAPPARAPLHSLLRAADTGRDADPRWQLGLTYAPEAVGGYRALPYCSDGDPLDVPGSQPTPVDYEPWELEVTDPCETTFGYNAAERDDRLRRAAEAIESYAIARELWTGEVAQAAANDNPYLAKDPTVVAAAPVSPKRGLGLLEQRIGEALRGQQAWLHVSREARPFFPELVKQGNLLFTNVDNGIVSDAGYPGTAPDGTAPAADVAWIYATGQVVVRRSSFELQPGDDAQVIDTRTNTVLRRGSKIVAATFDPAFLFACPITLT